MPAIPPTTYIELIAGVSPHINNSDGAGRPNQHDVYVCVCVFVIIFLDLRLAPGRRGDTGVYKTSPQILA